MHLEITAKLLTQFLKSLLPGCAGSKASLPVLRMVWLDARDGVLSGRTTDLDREIAARVAGVAVRKPGRCLVNAKDFAAVVAGVAEVDEEASDAPEVMVHLNCEDSDAPLRVQSGGRRALLPILDAAEMVPEVSGFGEAVEIPAVLLSRLLALTLPAVSTDESRYVLGGVRFLLNGSQLMAEATDGRRLIRGVCETWACAGKYSFIVPRKTAEILAKECGGGDEMVTVEFGGVQGKSIKEARFTLPGGRVRVASKLIEGTWPECQKVIPPLGRERVKVDRAGLAAMVERAKIIANGNPVVMITLRSDGVSVVQCCDPDRGEWEEEGSLFASDMGPEKNQQMTVNPDYLAMLAAGECATAELNVAARGADGFGPLHFLGTEGRKETELRVQWILMPMRRDAAETPAPKSETKPKAGRKAK